MRKAQILILTVPHGTAHERLGTTLKKAIEKNRPDLQVETVNALDHSSSWFRAYYNSYQLPLKYWPTLWGWIEGFQHTHSATGPGWLYRHGAKKLARMIRSHAPDIVIATEVGICELAALIKNHQRLDFQLVAVPTGIDTDLPWVQPEVDLYIAEPHYVAPFLKSQGVPHSKVPAGGVPVDPAFGSFANRAEVRKNLGLLPHLPVLLILFGGTGIGKPNRMIMGMKSVQTTFQSVWITGHNVNLAQQLRLRLANCAYSHVLGWTDKMPEWMAAADLLLGKPGSGTLLEAMNSGLPVLAFDPLPGIERRHCNVIEAWQIGRWIRRPEELAGTIDDLFIHPEKLLNFRDNALKKVCSGAAQKAASAILELLPSGTGKVGTKSLTPKTQ